MHKIILLLTASWGIMQGAYYLPQLPETVPIHYGFSGAADRWASKDTMMWLNTGLFVLITGLFYAIVYLAEKGSLALINVPNKEYWFTGKREAASRARLANMFAAMGSLTNFLFIAIFWLQARSILQGKDTLPPLFFALLTGYILAISALTIWLVACFRKPKQPEHS